MFEIKFDTRDGRRFVNALRQVPQALRKELSEALRHSARDVARTTRQVLRGSGKRKRGAEVGSAPGSPPLKRTGRLAKSIRVRKVRGGLTYRILSLDHPARGPIGLWLELGTQKGGRRVTQKVKGRRRSIRFGGETRNAPRPFLTLALAQNEKATTARVGASIRTVLQRIARESP